MNLKFKLVIAYDGTAYQGWQVQKIGTGVQEKIEAAFGKMFPSVKRIHSSSRTDTGVHALGMVAHVEIPRAEFKMPVARLALALNAFLPDDIRVLSAVRVPEKFHARFDATGKQYRYFVWNHAAMNPLLQNRAWHFPVKVDLAKMRAAAKLFIGKHDFRSFRRHAQLRNGIQRAHADALRHQKIRRANHVHHRRRRFSLQNVPRHRGNFGAGRPGENSAGESGRYSGQSRPARGGHDRASAWVGFVESILAKRRRSDRGNLK